jgi:hypothetical protein
MQQSALMQGTRLSIPFADLLACETQGRTVTEHDKKKFLGLGLGEYEGIKFLRQKASP